MTSLEVRSHLVDALRLDLIGPEPGSPLAEEVLPQPPTQWYLTGFLAPFDAEPEQRSESTSEEGLDQAIDAGATDDATAPEKQAARKSFFPSSIGVSVLVPKEAKSLKVVATWGEYAPPGATDIDPDAPPPQQWMRTPRRSELVVSLPASDRTKEQLLPGTDGVFIATSVRAVKDAAQFLGQIPKGTRAVSVFLVNKRKLGPNSRKDAGFIFQAALELHLEVPFVARPNLRELNSKDWDERVADVHYLDVFEYAVASSRSK